MDHLVETLDNSNGNVGVGKRVLTKEISEMRKITWKRHLINLLLVSAA